MTRNEPNSEHRDKVDQIDRMIHSPTRLKILLVLAAVVKADFTFLANSTNLTRGNLSANLRKLEEVGYVSIEKGFVGRVSQTLVRLTGEGRSALKAYNKKMRTVLDDLQGNLS
jgi:DNA-binding MarR family transcriptional regulator